MPCALAIAGGEAPDDEAIAAALDQGRQVVANFTISSIQRHREVVKPGFQEINGNMQYLESSLS